MGVPQITRTGELTSDTGVPRFVVHRTGAGPLVYAAAPRPEGAISVLSSDMSGWCAPTAEELGVLDATAAGRRRRQRVERGTA